MRVTACLLALSVITLILLAVVFGLSLAHALELPGKRRLSREQYLVVQRIYHPGFTYAGFCEPLAPVALLVLLLWMPGASPRFWLMVAALACSGITHVLYWVLTAPANKVWLEEQQLSDSAQRFFSIAPDKIAGQDWTILRDRWERSHVWRALAAGAAFVLQAAAVAL